MIKAGFLIVAVILVSTGYASEKCDILSPGSLILQRDMIVPGGEIPADAYNSSACADNQRFGVRGETPEARNKRFHLKRIYDIYSWRTFIAVNSPSGKKNSEHLPRWASWKAAYEVFLPDGSVPAGWNPDSPPAAPRNKHISLASGVGQPVREVEMPAYDKPLRRDRLVLFEIQQASSRLPLWDQNGNPVYYSTLLDEDQFNTINKYELFHLHGQICNYQKFGDIWWSQGFPTHNQLGAMEMKLAWKILEPGEPVGRYFNMEAYIPDANGWRLVRVGLTGMHIIHRTLASPDWIWTTFEHVDNLQVNELDSLNYAQQAKWSLRPAFNDPDCPTCPINELPLSGVDGKRRTQVHRVAPIAKTTEQLNSQVREILKTEQPLFDMSLENESSVLEKLNSGTLPATLAKILIEHGVLPGNYVLLQERPGSAWQLELGKTGKGPEARLAIRSSGGRLSVYRGSVWQYYQLVGTQFATEPVQATGKPTPSSRSLPERIENKSGSWPTPVYLVNPVIETYDQRGNQPASNLVRGPFDDAREQVFGTQSCMGCHRSASMSVVDATRPHGKPQALSISGTGGFSFLLGRARWQADTAGKECAK